MQLIGVVPTDTSVLARTGEIYDNDGDKSQAFQYYYDVSCSHSLCPYGQITRFLLI